VNPGPRGVKRYVAQPVVQDDQAQISVMKQLNMRTAEKYVAPRPPHRKPGKVVRISIFIRLRTSFSNSIDPLAYEWLTFPDSIDSLQ
jgi:hypothetical protein